MRHPVGNAQLRRAFEAQAYEHPVWRLRLSGSGLRGVMAEQPRLLVSDHATSTRT